MYNLCIIYHTRACRKIWPGLEPKCGLARVRVSIVMVTIGMIKIRVRGSASSGLQHATSRLCADPDCTHNPIEELSLQYVGWSSGLSCWHCHQCSSPRFYVFQPLAEL